jgi:lipopolysaccharide/colanic/teichoic acid biosynthesis glycosyltransferase
MPAGGRKAAVLLFIGDVLLFVLSLWVTLWVRYQELPTAEFFLSHLSSFAVLFAIWTFIFYISGLYSKRMLLTQHELTGTILRTQLLNVTVAALYFFLATGVNVTPRASLAIYLVISLIFIYVWRLLVVPRITRPLYRERAAIVGSGPDMAELVAEVNGNTRYPLQFKVVASPEEVAANPEAFNTQLVQAGVRLLVIDSSQESIKPVLPLMYKLAFVEQRYQCADLYQVYEEVFDRVPLSLLNYDWFLKNISPHSVGFYAFAKRAIDIAGALLMGAVTLILVPLVYLAMRLEGPGPLFLKQERFGLNGSRVRAYKFRSMRFDNSASREWVKEERENHVTRVGALLRKTSLDEFPQFINVLKGELSLIGPRNDIEGLGMRLAEALPYYMIRYMVKPGITGWAQINQRYEPGNASPQSIEETKTRLAYDFYYIKHRSIALDIVIALKTFKRMLFRVSLW